MKFAYHAVVHALEARSGWTSTTRFAAAVKHALHGYLPYERHHAAGLHRDGAQTCSTQIQSLVRDFLATDMNPVTRCFENMTHTAVAIRVFNAFNQKVHFGVRTTFDLPFEWASEASTDLRRETVTTMVDPASCLTATTAAFSFILQKVHSKACQTQRGCNERSAHLSDVARYLGVENLCASEVSAVLEHESGTSVLKIASTLGCHPRTLQRQLRAEGLNVELLHQAARLLNATDRLMLSAHNLTTIAQDTGFADLAHMSRAFKRACGVSPSWIRKSVSQPATSNQQPATSNQQPDEHASDKFHQLQNSVVTETCPSRSCCHSSRNNHMHQPRIGCTRFTVNKIAKQEPCPNVLLIISFAPW